MPQDEQEPLSTVCSEATGVLIIPDSVSTATNDVLKNAKHVKSFLVDALFGRRCNKSRNLGQVGLYGYPEASAAIADVNNALQIVTKIVEDLEKLSKPS